MVGDLNADVDLKLTTLFDQLEEQLGDQFNIHKKEI